MGVRSLSVGVALTLGCFGAVACSGSQGDSGGGMQDGTDNADDSAGSSSSSGSGSGAGAASSSAADSTSNGNSATNGSGGGSSGDSSGGTGNGGASGTADGVTGSGGGAGTGPLVAASCPEACPTAESGVSCCAREALPSGSFAMGRSQSGSDACPPEQTCAGPETPEHEATVAAFELDVFEVTVARFRPFVEAYDGFRPAHGSGSHPLVEESGWKTEWSAQLPSDRQTLETHLACDAGATYRATASDTEALPINCLTWFEALAFCIYSGGRLPTEAEWEYAAAGGSEDRLYPWGNEAPTSEHARFYPDALGPVGGSANGRARWGQLDMAGNVWEWALDWLDPSWYESAGNPCENCANVASGSHRVLRGGAYSFESVTLRAATRSAEEPTARQPFIGVRCARDTNPD